MEAVVEKGRLLPYLRSVYFKTYPCHSEEEETSRFLPLSNPIVLHADLEPKRVRSDSAQAYHGRFKANCLRR
jgi:hypothetical protein